MDANEIRKLATEINGKSRSRTLGTRETEQFIELVEQHRDNPEIKSIRVYSRQGFVPNAYKWRAMIAALTAFRKADGVLEIYGGWYDAHRSGGDGALVTINNRAA